MIKSKFMLETSIPNKPQKKKKKKNTKAKECVEPRLATKKPIRQFRIKERIEIYTR